MRSIVVVLFVALLFGCRPEEKSVPPPANLLPRDKMVKVLVDMNILEAAVRFNTIREKKISDSLFYFNIYKAHNITREQYDASMQYYSRDPDVIISIMDEVINELSRKQAQEVRKVGP